MKIEIEINDEVVKNVQDRMFEKANSVFGLAFEKASDFRLRYTYRKDCMNDYDWKIGEWNTDKIEVSESDKYKEFKSYIDQLPRDQLTQELMLFYDRYYYAYELLHRAMINNLCTQYYEQLKILESDYPIKMYELNKNNTSLTNRLKEQEDELKILKGKNIDQNAVDLINKKLFKYKFFTLVLCSFTIIYFLDKLFGG